MKELINRIAVWFLYWEIKLLRKAYQDHKIDKDYFNSEINKIHLTISRLRP